MLYSGEMEDEIRAASRRVAETLAVELTRLSPAGRGGYDVFDPGPLAEAIADLVVLITQRPPS